MTGAWGETAWDGGKKWDAADGGHEAQDDNKNNWGEDNWDAEETAQDPMDENTKKILEYFPALAERKTWSKNYIALLENGLKNAVQEPKYSRNEVQTSIVEEIRDGFQLHRVFLEKKVLGKRTAYEAAEEFGAQAVETKEKLNIALEDLQSKKEVATTNLEEAKADLEARKEELETAKNGYDALTAKLKEDQLMINRAVNVMTREFLPIKEDPNARARIEKITDLLEKMGAELALVKSIEVCLKDTARGPVANLLIQETEKFLTEKLQELKESRERLELDGEKNVNEAVEKAEAVVANAWGKVTEAENKLASIEADIKICTDQVGNCDRSLEDPHAFKEELKEFLETAEAEVEKFMESAEAFELMERGN